MAAVLPCRGLLGTCATVAKEEGAKALWSGIEPGVTVSGLLMCLSTINADMTRFAVVQACRSSPTGPLWRLENWPV